MQSYILLPSFIVTVCWWDHLSSLAVIDRWVPPTGSSCSHEPRGWTNSKAVPQVEKNIMVSIGLTEDLECEVCVELTCRSDTKWSHIDDNRCVGKWNQWLATECYECREQAFSREWQQVQHLVCEYEDYPWSLPATTVTVFRHWHGRLRQINRSQDNALRSEIFNSPWTKIMAMKKLTLHPGMIFSLRFHLARTIPVGIYVQLSGATAHVPRT